MRLQIVLLNSILWKVNGNLLLLMRVYNIIPLKINGLTKVARVV